MLPLDSIVQQLAVNRRQRQVLTQAHRFMDRAVFPELNLSEDVLQGMKEEIGGMGTDEPAV
jgi:hypothetical protein